MRTRWVTVCRRPTGQGPRVLVWDNAGEGDRRLNPLMRFVRIR